MAYLEVMRDGRVVAQRRLDPDSRRIVSGSLDKTMRIWDALGGTGLAVLRGHEGTVMCVSYNPDGRRIASGSEDG